MVFVIECISFTGVFVHYTYYSLCWLFFSMFDVRLFNVRYSCFWIRFGIFVWHCMHSSWNNLSVRCAVAQTNHLHPNLSSKIPWCINNVESQLWVESKASNGILNWHWILILIHLCLIIYNLGNGFVKQGNIIHIYSNS